MFVSLLIIIVSHELGHMVAALLCGVKVEAFSVGFGKVLLHKKLWGIDFRLSMIPLGGYCRLEGEKGKVKTGWLTQRYSKKLVIVLAGVTVNLLTAFICYWINFKSISIGLQTDFLLMKYLITKNHYGIYLLISAVRPNLFLLQLSFMSLAAFITNIAPIPALDGGYVWLFLLEKKLKNKFVSFLEKITKIGFWVLMIAQIILLGWIWFI